jgi:hypothetical protein
MKAFRFAAFLVVLAFVQSLRGEPSAPSTVWDLSGRWRYQLDREDAGMAERWFERRLEKTLRLPGSLPGQGIGDPVTLETEWVGGIVDRSWFTAPEYEAYRQPGRVKVPFWLQPETYYAGVAWYQREMEIPAAGADQRFGLLLERPHWETRVWIDDRFIGRDDALGTPHVYDLGTIAPGTHRLTIRVDNRRIIDVGENSHSISDHTQGNWNGIVGRIELHATPKVWIRQLQVYPHLASRTITVKGHVANSGEPENEGRLRLEVLPALTEARSRQQVERTTLCQASIEVRWSRSGGDFEAELALGTGALSWDEFNPAVYELVATLEPGGHRTATWFGLREIAAQGTQFTVNGRKTFIRGTLDCCIYPRTGHPPTDVASWRQVIETAKAHGLNSIRFHSWCPPQAAFVAADQLGFYLHVECSSWPNQSTTLGDGKPIDRWLYEEADRILNHYGNHPSFVFLVSGNEPGGPRHGEYLSQWVKHYREADPRRLYSGGSGWPQLPEDQFHVTPDPRVQAWGAGLKSRINANPPETTTDYRDYIQTRAVPVVSHEIGQWCVYPNFDEMRKYTGYLKPRNFEIFRSRLRANHLGDLARDFLHASGKLQTLCYKEDIESALRTPGMGGFQLLDLHDFPGQGTALVGVLDPFWESKGYVEPEEFHRFCGETVPLARLERRIFTNGDTLVAEVEVAHFGSNPLAGATATWQLLADTGRVVESGVFPTRDVPVGNGIALGRIEVNLRTIPSPARYRLVVSLDQNANDWDIWVYPNNVGTQPSADVLVTRELDGVARAALEGGRKVLWLIAPDRVAPDARLGPVALGFSSIFWNTAWTGRQAPHTLGILCDPEHPLFARFPTDSHSNWQWWYLIRRSGAMIMDQLPPRLRPEVQVIDDWVSARRLGLLFEARVGRGKLMVCSIDLEPSSDPVVRQFRHSLMRYLGSEDFKPRQRATLEEIRTVLAE